MFKVSNRNTRKRCEICSKLTIKIPERKTYFTPFSSVSIVNVEQVNTGWEECTNLNQTPTLSSLWFFIFLRIILIRSKVVIIIYLKLTDSIDRLFRMWHGFVFISTFLVVKSLFCLNPETSLVLLTFVNRFYLLSETPTTTYSGLSPIFVFNIQLINPKRL